MKKLLIILFALLLPNVSHAGNYLFEVYWVCHQVGSIEDAAAQATSNVFTSWQSSRNDDYSHDGKERYFGKRVLEATKGKFIPFMSPRCRDYSNEKKALKAREKKVRTALDQKLEVVNIDM